MIGLQILPRKFKVSDDVNYYSSTYDPRQPYLDKDQAIINAASWFYPDFAFRKLLTITNNTTSAITDAPVLVNVSIVSGKMNADFSDLRFSFVNPVTGNEEAAVFLVEFSDSSNARLWLKIPTMAASANIGCYLYYGNPGAASAEDWTWMYAAFNFETDEGLTWKESGTAESYGDSAGVLRSNASQIDFVSLVSNGSHFVYKSISTIAATDNFRVRSRAKFQSTNQNTPYFAVSGAAEIKKGTAGQLTLGMRFASNKAKFMKANGTTTSSTTGPTANSNDTWYILEVKVIGSTAYPRLKANSTNNDIDSFPDNSLTGYTGNRLFVHAVLGDDEGATCDGSCNLLLVMKAFSTDPSVSTGSEESRPY